MGMGHLPLERMKQIIRDERGSVSFGNRVISKLEDLPTATELAETDEQIDTAEADLSRKMEELKTQQEGLLRRRHAIHQATQQAEDAAKPQMPPQPSPLQPQRQVETGTAQVVLPPSVQPSDRVGRQILHENAPVVGRQILDQPSTQPAANPAQFFQPPTNPAPFIGPPKPISDI